MVLLSILKDLLQLLQIYLGIHLLIPVILVMVTLPRIQVDFGCGMVIRGTMLVISLVLLDLEVFKVHRGFKELKVCKDLKDFKVHKVLSGL
jgi:hypothetical protein